MALPSSIMCSPDHELPPTHRGQPHRPTNPNASRMAQKVGGADGCPRCGQAVYAAEKVIGGGKVRRGWDGWATASGVYQGEGLGWTHGLLQAQLGVWWPGTKAWHQKEILASLETRFSSCTSPAAPLLQACRFRALLSRGDSGRPCCWMRSLTTCAGPAVLCPPWGFCACPVPRARGGGTKSTRKGLPQQHRALAGSAGICDEHIEGQPRVRS